MALRINPWEHQNAIKALYAKCVGEICKIHKVTRMELDILLFLANYPRCDTAKEIAKTRHLSKSQVSESVKLLESRGYLRKEYEENNRKTAHLIICDAACHIVEDGRKAQTEFLEIIVQGISEEEMNCLKRCFDKMGENIDRYLACCEKA